MASIWVCDVDPYDRIVVIKHKCASNAAARTFIRKYKRTFGFEPNFEITEQETVTTKYPAPDWTYVGA